MRHPTILTETPSKADTLGCIPSRKVSRYGMKYALMFESLKRYIHQPAQWRILPYYRSHREFAKPSIIARFERAERSPWRQVSARKARASFIYKTARKQTRVDLPVFVDCETVARPKVTCRTFERAIGRAENAPRWRVTERSSVLLPNTHEFPMLPWRRHDDSLSPRSWRFGPTVTQHDPM